MSADNNTPAFPTPPEHGFNFGMPGMSLRDYFAAKAMQGLLAADTDFLMGHDAIAICAIAQADAMMKAREVVA